MPNATDILDRYGRAFANSAADARAGEALNRSTDHTRADEAFHRCGTKPACNHHPLSAPGCSGSDNPTNNDSGDTIGRRPVLNRGSGKSAVPRRYSRMGEP